MRRASPWIAAAMLAALVGSSSRAQANGRFPESNQITFSPHDPDLVLLRVTFGLLVSHDRGRTFDWVCEQAIGGSGVEDPMYTVTPSKAYVATTFAGITISRDQACSWSFAPGDLASQVFIDLSANPTDTKNIVVFASSYDQQDDAGNIRFKSKVWETKDEAQSFSQIAQLDPSLLGYTIDLAGTDPNRVYITAIRNPGPTPEALLLTSKDHGRTWEEQLIPLENKERSLWVAGVDPNDAERVYLRTYNTAPDQPTRLLLREAKDGGPPTIRTLHTASGALAGFALSADGTKVYIGGPKDGLKVASTDTFEFQQRSTLEVQCLARNEEGLWACSNEKSGFVAGVSKDDGVTFESRLHFCEIRGPLACSAGTPTQDICGPVWAVQKANLGCSPPSSDAGDGDADAAPTNVGASPSSGACHCQTAPAGPWGAVVTAVGAALALVRRYRRDTRRR